MKSINTLHQNNILFHHKNIFVALLSLLSYMPLANAQTCSISNPAISGSTDGLTTADVGQSFVLSTCLDGTITGISVFSFTNNTGITLTVYEGEGFGGNKLFSQSNLSIQAGVGMPLVNDFSISPAVEFEMNETLTFRFELTDGGSFQLAKSTELLPLVEGNLYENGTPLPNEDLFFIVTTEASLLPVELTFFDAKKMENEVELNWQTASETNNYGFDIQRSADGKIWNSIGFVEGQGTTNRINNYQFIDAKPLSGTSFYRLQQFDYDGQHQYSDIQSIRFDTYQAAGVRLFPNPAVAGQVLHIQSDGEPIQAIQLLTASGQSVATITPTDQLTTQLELPSDLPKGLYILSIAHNSGITTSQKLMIQ